jgi:molybdopterin molybdotransferase
MISVKQAQSKILKHLNRLGNEQIKLSKAINRVLASDIISPVSHPVFNQSAVDGYAIRFKDLKKETAGANIFKIIGESKAGEFRKFKIKPNEAVRIFTGALVPRGFDTVTMQEDVTVKNSKIILRILPSCGANVRKKGEQIKKGMIALRKGTALNPASIGFLASLGIEGAEVSKLPNVSVIITGNEFTKSKEKLRKGSIYESNGLMLTSLLSILDIKAHSNLCEDNLNKLTKLIKKESDKNDITIISGGVSVGDYDFTEQAVKNLDFKIIFHKVFQKPGKPILFAKRKNKTVFGLPGNPRSVLICFWEYVYPFILASMGNKKPFLKNINFPIAHNYDKKEEKTLFLSSKLIRKRVYIHEGQASHLLKSFSSADAIVCLPEGKKNYTAGELVNVHILPY